MPYSTLKPFLDQFSRENDDCSTIQINGNGLRRCRGCSEWLLIELLLEGYCQSCLVTAEEDFQVVVEFERVRARLVETPGSTVVSS